MISSPSAQIVNAIAESISISAVGGPSVPAYGPTMAIMTAIIALGIAVTTAFGPEKRGSRFESVVVGQLTEAQEARRKVEGDVEKRGESSSSAGIREAEGGVGDGEGEKSGVSQAREVEVK